MIAAPLILGAATAAMSYAQAQAANKGVRRSMASAQKAITLESGQVDQAAEVEQTKRRNEAEQIAGHIRVATAANGAGVGGTYQALQRQANYDEAYNAWILGVNRNNQQIRLASGLEANLIELGNRRVNATLAGLNGAIGGASTGLNLYSSATNAGIFDTPLVPATNPNRGYPVT